jgi:hypothetical protein
MSVTVTPGKDDVRSDVDVGEGQVDVDLYSESGIGSADIRFANISEPIDLLLRMHLSGLENLVIRSADSTVEASVGSTPPYEIRQSVDLGDGELIEIDSTSPHWLTIELVPNDNTIPAEIPLESGYFEVGLSGYVYAGDGDSISVSWIDFYR